MAHHTNFVVQLLGGLKKIKLLFSFVYNYFIHNPTWQLELNKLVKLLEGKHKFEKCENTLDFDDMSLYKKVLVEYKTLVVKMAQNNVIIGNAKVNYELLHDVETLLVLSHILPLFKVV